MTTWNDPQPQKLQQYTEWVTRPDGKPPVQCTTSISVPQFDDGTQQLHSRMKEPEPEAGQ